jgi:hypothetical protein
MKKIAVIFLMCLTLATTSYAQVGFKLKAGASLTNVSFNEDINDQFPGNFTYGSKVGFVIGMAAEIPLGSDKFTLQPELLFHQKGYTSKYSDTETSANYTTTLNYLDIPVMARVKFGNFTLGAGPYFAFGVGGNYKGTDTYAGHTQENEGKVKFGKQPTGYSGRNAYVNAFDFGFAAGAGIKISAIEIDLRFGLGLLDIIDKNDLDTRTLNRSLQLTVGLPIVAKKK